MSTCRQAIAARRKANINPRYKKQKSKDVAYARQKRLAKISSKRAKMGSIYTGS